MRVRLGAGRALESATLAAGEAPPALGDVLVLGPSWGCGDAWSAVRVERVRGRTVWYENVTVRRPALGSSRWELAPVVGRRNAERLRRR